MAPSTPRSVSVAMARRSSRLDTPPEAITGASVRSATLRQQVEVRTVQRAVLGDVGDDEPRTALAVKAFQHLPQIAAVGLPAAAAQPVLAVDDLHVQADGDLVAVLGDRLGAPLRVLQRRGAEVDPGAAGRQRGRQRLVVADAAGQLDLHVELADHLGQQFAVGAAAERGVEVDEVDPLGAVALPGQRGVQRGAVLGFAAGLALHQAHRLAVDHVDGGQQESMRTAVNASPLDPIAQQRRTGVAALLRVKLGGRQRAVLDGGQERHVVGGPRQQRVGSALPLLRGVGVHEVEPGVGVEALEQRAAGRGRRRRSSPCAGSPAHPAG